MRERPKMDIGGCASLGFRFLIFFKFQNLRPPCNDYENQLACNELKRKGT